MSEHLKIIPDWYREAMAGAERLEAQGDIAGAERVRHGANQSLMQLDRLKITIKGEPFMGEEGSTQLTNLKRQS